MAITSKTTSTFVCVAVALVGCSAATEAGNTADDGQRVSSAQESEHQVVSTFGSFTVTGGLAADGSYRATVTEKGVVLASVVADRNGVGSLSIAANPRAKSSLDLKSPRNLTIANEQSLFAYRAAAAQTSNHAFDAQCYTGNPYPQGYATCVYSDCTDTCSDSWAIDCWCTNGPGSCTNESHQSGSTFHYDNVYCYNTGSPNCNDETCNDQCAGQGSGHGYCDYDICYCS